MAHWAGAGGLLTRSFGHTDGHALHKCSSKREARLPVILHDDSYGYDLDDTSLYPRPRSWESEHMIATPPGVDPSPKQPQFFVIREGTPASTGLRDGHCHVVPPSGDGQFSPEPAPVACFMERTNSGRTILTDSDSHSTVECNNFSPEEDKAAAARVRSHMNSPRRDVRRHERILRSLIHPRNHRGADFALDETALESIFSAADEIFFQGRLSRRVQWEWSSSEQNDYSRRIIGTTALREAQPPLVGGYETLIVLSSPFLRDTKFNRRLLISTFLHELIHSYLFICCGFKARHCGGHTQGFKEIADAIDEWAGRGTLRLCDMEADLAHFKEVERSPVIEHSQPGHHDFGCGGETVPWPFDMPPWTTGPRVVLQAHVKPGGMQLASNTSTPASSTSTLVGQSQREMLLKPDEAVSRMLEMAANTFAGSGTKVYY
ncbi:hypothetical protein KVR01_006686 [Diaporthe batatas]|uniref:uncharacterized protein n=1 Tax=Diaporthe batatas TaxID=748121 RepID=UPI001D05989C|nr:uncharacterized protein KVR01_006686 [Diaporthe batatas]KAG8163389.1 hypothetical protein KVR01_006686 [Diaporthe batatas]